MSAGASGERPESRIQASYQVRLSTESSAAGALVAQTFRYHPLLLQKDRVNTDTFDLESLPSALLL